MQNNYNCSIKGGFVSVHPPQQKLIKIMLICCVNEKSTISTSKYPTFDIFTQMTFEFRHWLIIDAGSLLNKIKHKIHAI